MSNPVTSISSLLPKTSTTSELGDLTTITSKSLFTITHSRIITLSSSTINPTITTSPAPSSQMTSLDTEATNPTFPAFPTLPTLTVPAIQFGAPYTEKGLSAGAKAGIAIGVIIAVLLLACLGFALLRRKRGKSAIPSWRDRRKAAHPAGISELPTTSKREDTQDVPVFTGIDAVPSKKKWWSPRDIIASPVFEKPSRSDTKKFPAENIAELDAAPPEARKAELPGNDVPRPKGTTSSIREGDVRILSPNFYPDFGDMTVGRESRVTMIGLGDEIGVYLREMDRVEESNGEVKEYGNGDKALGRGRDVLSENMEMLRVKKELERREGGHKYIGKDEGQYSMTPPGSVNECQYSHHTAATSRPAPEQAMHQLIASQTYSFAIPKSKRYTAKTPNGQTWPKEKGQIKWICGRGLISTI